MWKWFHSHSFASVGGGVGNDKHLKVFIQPPNEAIFTQQRQQQQPMSILGRLSFTAFVLLFHIKTPRCYTADRKFAINMRNHSSSGWLCVINILAIRTANKFP